MRWFRAVALLSLAVASQAHGVVTWNVTVNDTTGNYSALTPTLITAAQVAGQTWSNDLLPSNASIEVQINIQPVPSGRGDGASAAFSFVQQKNGFNIFEQGAAAEIRTGVDPNGATPDVYIDLDPTYIDTQLWFDPNPTLRTAPVPNNRVDDMSVFLHEIGHALAFNGWRDGTTGSIPADYESTFDANVTMSQSIGFFTGPNVESVYGGPVPLTYGNIYHVGNNSPTPGADLIPDLMNGVVFNWGQRYYIGSLDLAMLADSGVSVALTSIPEPGPTLFSSILAGCLLLRRRRVSRVLCYD